MCKDNKRDNASDTYERVRLNLDDIKWQETHFCVQSRTIRLLRHKRCIYICVYTTVYIIRALYMHNTYIHTYIFLQFRILMYTRHTITQCTFFNRITEVFMPMCVIFHHYRVTFTLWIIRSLCTFISRFTVETCVASSCVLRYFLYNIIIVEEEKIDYGDSFPKWDRVSALGDTKFWARATDEFIAKAIPAFCHGQLKMRARTLIIRGTNSYRFSFWLYFLGMDSVQ